MSKEGDDKRVTHDPMEVISMGILNYGGRRWNRPAPSPGEKPAATYGRPITRVSKQRGDTLDQGTGPAIGGI